MNSRSEDIEIIEVALSTKSPTIDLIRLEELLSKGADPNTTSHQNLFDNNSSSKNFAFPLLHLIACKFNSVEAAKILLKCGADITQTDNCIGNTALLTAIALLDDSLALFYIDYISKSNSNAVKVILNQKDQGEECGNTPLVLALKKDNEKMDIIANRLIELGAKADLVTRESNTALHWGSMLRKNEIIQNLLFAGAQVNVINAYGHTPGEYYNYNLRIIDFAPPISEKDLPSLATNLLELSDYAHQNHSNLSPRYRFKIFINTVAIRNKQFDQTISLKLKSENIPIKSLEARHEKIRALQYSKLMEQKLKIDSQWSRFITDREMSYFIDFLREVVEEEKLERVNARFDPFKAHFSRAVFEKDESKIHSLLQSKKNEIDFPDCEGFTALHWAAMRRDDKTIKLLLENGASSIITNQFGRSALDYYQLEIPSIDSDKISEFKFIYQNPHFPELRNARAAKSEILKMMNSKSLSTEYSSNTNIENPLTGVSKFFLKNNVIPAELQNALTDGNVNEYIKKGYATLESLSEIYIKKPWIIDALRCSNIRKGIYKNFITVEQLTELSEVQVNMIVHKFEGNKLKLQVENYIHHNKGGIMQNKPGQ